ncbi:MAG: hypothetical protein CVU65_00275 [Deltaproteobacteria bacterium HGW-Deltaproteobacteria-22]|jgi:hypothetical protein|nr:MAG: hypothetical protein CVU65_00275 [Deltaproteobacteria bacterium HGW-Deltaproteobacteria-22]
MTLVSTCELDGVNPEDYLKEVLVRVSNATTPEQIAYLRPHNYKPLTAAA